MSLELGNGIVALRGDLPCLGEMISPERRLMCQDGDLGFLGRDSLCGCALQRGVCVLEVGEFVAEREKT